MHQGQAHSLRGWSDFLLLDCTAGAGLLQLRQYKCRIKAKQLGGQLGASRCHGSVRTKYSLRMMLCKVAETSYASNGEKKRQLLNKTGRPVA